MTMKLADRVYLARFYESDGPTLMGVHFNRSRQYITVMIDRMKSNGEYKLYRSLSFEEYEKIMLCAEAKNGTVKQNDSE